MVSAHQTLSWVRKSPTDLTVGSVGWYWPVLCPDWTESAIKLFRNCYLIMIEQSKPFLVLSPNELLGNCSETARKLLGNCSKTALSLDGTRFGDIFRPKLVQHNLTMYSYCLTNIKSRINCSETALKLLENCTMPRWYSIRWLFSTESDIPIASETYSLFKLPSRGFYNSERALNPPGR